MNSNKFVYDALEIQFEVKRVMDAPAVIDEHDVTSDDHIAPSARSRPKAADQFRWRGVCIPPHSSIDDVAFAEAGFIPIAMPVFVPEAANIVIVAMIAIPIARGLAIVIVKMLMAIAVMSVILSADGARHHAQGGCDWHSEPQT